MMRGAQPLISLIYAKRGFFKPLFAMLLLLATSSTFAEESLIGESVAKPSDYFGQIMLSLVLVLLIIFLAAWLLRRYGRFPGVADGNLRVIGALSVGQRERILLLQVGKEQILVGVTSSKISTLHQLTDLVDSRTSEPMKGPFAQRLQEALSQRKGASKQSEQNDVSQINSENP